MNNTTYPKTNSQPEHLLWLDNLRTFIVFLVVLIHAGGVYESSGTWAGFWIVDDPATNNHSGLIFIVMDIFMMPVLFFISGYLMPASLAGKGPWKFIKSKFKRLMVPWIVAVLTLIPLYKVIFLASRGLPQESWTTYFHFSNGTWGMNWLWFLPALFAINLVYLAVASLRFRMPDLSIHKALAIAFAIGLAYSLLMDFNGLRGWTKLPLIDFQNERALIYVLSFWLGAHFFRKNAFAAKPKIGWLYYTVSATNWIPVMLYIILLLYPWFNAGSYLVSEPVHKTAIWLNFHLSLISMAYLLIQTFRKYLTRQSALVKILNRNSYAVYILHVVVQGGIAWYMLQLSTPSFLKHLILAVSSYAVSCVLVSGYQLASNKLLKQYSDERANRTSKVSNHLVEHGAGSQAG